eukprot:TRINITY_DN727_c1_g2_i1.p1 TRINITY_DN727_c1_g2~~TRINITY_DN727_c1_g2_i1.p1  ORF type:complete len:846 (+),score=177.07 TRINITY_DN727_c1_g2_i1:39-2540(+)
MARGPLDTSIDAARGGFSAGGDSRLRAVESLVACRGDATAPSSRDDRGRLGKDCASGGCIATPLLWAPTPKVAAPIPTCLNREPAKPATAASGGSPLERDRIDLLFYPTTLMPLTEYGFSKIEESLPLASQAAVDMPPLLAASQRAPGALSASLLCLAQPSFDACGGGGSMGNSLDSQVEALVRAKNMASVQAAHQRAQLRTRQEQVQRDAWEACQRAKELQAELTSPGLPCRSASSAAGVDDGIDAARPGGVLDGMTDEACEFGGACASPSPLAPIRGSSAALEAAAAAAAAASATLANGAARGYVGQAVAASAGAVCGSDIASDAAAAWRCDGLPVAAGSCGCSGGLPDKPLWSDDIWKPLPAYQPPRRAQLPSALSSPLAIDPSAWPERPAGDCGSGPVRTPSIGSIATLPRDAVISAPPAEFTTRLLEAYLPGGALTEQQTPQRQFQHQHTFQRVSAPAGSPATLPVPTGTPAEPADVLTMVEAVGAAGPDACERLQPSVASPFPQSLQSQPQQPQQPQPHPALQSRARGATEASDEQLQAVLEECQDTIRWCAQSLTRETLNFQDEPPKVVKLVLECVAMLCGQPEAPWEKLRRFVGAADFVTRVQRLNYQQSIPREKFLRLCERLRHPDFDEELVKTVSVPVAPLALWCRSIGVYLSKTKFPGIEEIRPAAGAGNAPRGQRGNSRQRAPRQYTSAHMVFDPDIEALSLAELQCVEELSILRPGVGRITFHGATDCTALDFEAVVRLEIGEVLVYPDAAEKPPVGTGLNKAATITLYQCWLPAGTKTDDARSRERARKKIKQMTEEKNARFVEYDCDTGAWTFRVSHF